MSVAGPAQSAVDWVNPVNWAHGAHWQRHWGGPRPATSAARAGATPTTKTAAALAGVGRNRATGLGEERG